MADNSDAPSTKRSAEVEDWTAVYILVALVPVGFLLAALYSNLSAVSRRKLEARLDRDMDRYQAWWFPWKQQQQKETTITTNEEEEEDLRRRGRSRRRRRDEEAGPGPSPDPDPDPIIPLPHHPGRALLTTSKWEERERERTRSRAADPAQAAKEADEKEDRIHVRRERDEEEDEQQQQQQQARPQRTRTTRSPSPPGSEAAAAKPWLPPGAVERWPAVLPQLRGDEDRKAVLERARQTGELGGFDLSQVLEEDELEEVLGPDWRGKGKREGEEKEKVDGK
ncbi:hypothetical protein VTK56DRAFT_3113 [Thermocarpiscus australiensis]